MSQITLSSVAKSLAEGFNQQAKKFTVIEQSIDELTTMVKLGFDHTGEQINLTQRDISAIKHELIELKLRQDNVAYRFELNELDRRVSQLEGSITRS